MPPRTLYNPEQGDHEMEALLGGIEANITEYYFKSRPIVYSIDYDHEYSSCFSRRASEWCFRELNAKHNINQSWFPRDGAGDTHYRKQPDCSYKARIVKAVASLTSLSFHIQVEQLQCNTTVPFEQSIGGSSFDMYGRSDIGLVRCYMSHVPGGNLYDYRCDFDESVFNSSATEACVFVTMLLQYEHFDAYSEVLASDAYHDYQYPPMGFPILDDDFFCIKLDRHSRKRETFIKSGIEYVGGLWKFGNSSMANLFDFQKIHPNFLTAYSFHEGARRIIDYHNYDVQFQPLLSSYLPSLFSDNLRFATFSSTANHTFNCNVTARIMERIMEREILKSSRQIYFIGASHMRYNFDALSELLFGEDVLPKDRKHDLADIGSLHFRGGMFANEVAGILSQICASGENLTNKNVTIFFQFGAWDLMYSTLRRLVYEPRTLQTLSRTIEKILDGNLRCTGVERLVWLTSLPYPNCFNEKDYHCWWLRTFKNDAAIASLNQIFLAELKRMKNRLLIPLTVIDAFSIVAPRLTLNYENEVICSNHFICRVEVGRGKTLRIAHIPGGSAVLESILRVIYR